MSRRLRRAFIGSAMFAIISSLLMLGSTVAWFQDTKIIINTFTYGDLKVMVTNSADSTVALQAVAFQRADGVLYGDGENLFEPGATFRLQDVYIRNGGDVPLQYRIALDAGSAEAAKTPDGRTLLDAMDIYYRLGSSLISGDAPQVLAPGEVSEPLQIYLHMRENAGNEYQNLYVSGAVVKVIAVQSEGIDENDAQQVFKSLST